MQKAFQQYVNGTGEGVEGGVANSAGSDSADKEAERSGGVQE